MSAVGTRSRSCETAVPALGRRTSGSVRLLQTQIWLLVLMPATLRFSIFGALGSPPVLFGLGLFGVWMVATGAPSIHTPRSCRPVRAVLVVTWSAVLVSFALLHVTSVVADESSNADRYLIFMLAFSGIALMAAEGIHGRDEQLQVMRTLVSAVATLCAVAILQARANLDLTAYVARLPGLSSYGTREAVLKRSGLDRPAGTATHPIEFGVVVGLTLPFALHLALHDRHWTRSRRWVTLGLIGLGIPIAVSRSALLVAVIVLCVFLLDADRTVRVASFQVLAALLALVFVAVPGLLGTLKGYVLAGQSDSSISTRTSDYAAVAGYLRASPWFGRGPGTFLPRLRILDNQYLLTLIETGVVGLVALLLLFSLPVWLGSASRMRATGAADRQLSRMFVAVGVALLASVSTFDAMSFPMFALICSLSIGLCGQHWIRCSTSL